MIEKHGTPALEQLITENPNEFVHLVTMVFKRDDGIADPSDEGSDEQRAKARHQSLEPA
ncbi:MAG: hypothetical protein R3E03_06375 [Novosphingobium sp.]